ncbi:hypothetical protein D3C71_2127930 [compost metagenome]
MQINMLSALGQELLTGQLLQQNTVMNNSVLRGQLGQLLQNMAGDNDRNVPLFI